MIRIWRRDRTPLCRQRNICVDTFGYASVSFNSYPKTSSGARTNDRLLELPTTIQIEKFAGSQGEDHALVVFL